MNHCRGPRVFPGETGNVSSAKWATKQNSAPDETIFRTGEDIRKLALVTKSTNETTGRKGP